MQAEAVALIRRYYDAFNAGDRLGMIECLSDDIRHDVNEGAARIGKDKFAAFMAQMDRCYRERLADIVIMAAADGGRAAAEFVVHGAYVSTDDGLPPARGQKYVLPAGAFFSVAQGRITRVTTFYNLKEWVRQVSAGA